MRKRIMVILMVLVCGKVSASGFNPNLMEVTKEPGKNDEQISNQQYTWDYNIQGIDNRQPWEKQQYTNERYWLEQFPGVRVVVDYWDQYVYVKVIGKNRTQAKKALHIVMDRYLGATKLWTQVSINGYPARTFEDAMKWVNREQPSYENKKNTTVAKKTIMLVQRSYIIRAKSYEQQIEKASELSGMPVHEIYTYIHRLTRFNPHAVGRDGRKGLMLIDENWEKEGYEKDLAEEELEEDLVMDEDAQANKVYNEETGWIMEEKPKIKEAASKEEKVQKEEPLENEKEIDLLVKELLIGINRIKALQKKYAYIKDDDARDNVIYAAYATSPKLIEEQINIDKNFDYYNLMAKIHENIKDDYVLNLLSSYNLDELRNIYLTLEWEYAKIVNP